MSTLTVETTRTAAAAVLPEPPIASTTVAFELVTESPVVSPAPEETTFLDDHPLVPVFVIGAISLVLSVATVASIVFWLAIRYSGVLAP